MLALASRIDDKALRLSLANRRPAELACHGLSNQEIGLKLGLTENTAKHDMTRILRKLHVRT